MHVASGFSCSTEAGLLAFVSRRISPTTNHGPRPASHFVVLFVLSELRSLTGGECRSRIEAPCKYVPGTYVP